MEGVQYAVKPKGSLRGTEVNLYALIGRVSGILKDHGEEEKMKEFVHRSLSLRTYVEVLRLSQDYVELEGENEPETD